MTSSCSRSLSKNVVVKDLRVTNEIEEYKITPKPVGCGGYGTVYKAKRKSDSKIFAMKFFGYVNGMHIRPDFDAINREVMLMMSLIGVTGVVQIESMFYDKEEGFLDGKNPNFCQSYPVIVMENISGGELFSRIEEREMRDAKTSERYLAGMFKSLVVALGSIHKKKYIHRDLKSQNVLLVSKDEDSSQVKIIDFGQMHRLDEVNDVFHDTIICGTRGCYAPETLVRKEYSSKSDIWQAGCVLYELLCLHPPFFPEDERQPDIINGRYFQGDRFARLSNDAKNLIDRIFQVDPDQRITIPEILDHNWMTGHAPDDDFGSEYSEEVKRLALRHKLKKIFNRGYPSSQSSASPPDLCEGSTTVDSIDGTFGAVADECTQDENIQIRYFFQKLDGNKDGRISKEELRNGVALLLLRENQSEEGNCHQDEGTAAVCPQVTLHIDELFEVMDRNHDGEIEFEEFRVFYNLLATSSSVTGTRNSAQSAIASHLGSQLPLSESKRSDRKNPENGQDQRKRKKPRV